MARKRKGLLGRIADAVVGKPSKPSRRAAKAAPKPAAPADANWVQRLAATLSPAYRRRLERGAAKGLTRQQSRGHVEKEHVKRKADERARAAATGALTTPQRANVRKFVKQQAAKAGLDAEDEWDDWKPFFEERGYAEFLRVRDLQRDLLRRGRGSVGSLDELERLADNYGVDQWMLYYH